ncbi:MAG: SAF domain-containing protein [Alphaproteobacteria bacterium]|nr:SAF domain-containing protein [Alphaproteobacteria bacterium]
MRHLWIPAFVLGAALGAVPTFAATYAVWLSDLDDWEVEKAVRTRLGLDLDPPCDPATFDREQVECMPCALRDLEPGATIGPADVEWRVWPQPYLPNEAVRRDVVGRVVGERLLRGELFREEKLR